MAVRGAMDGPPMRKASEGIQGSFFIKAQVKGRRQLLLCTTQRPDVEEREETARQREVEGPPMRRTCGKPWLVTETSVEDHVRPEFCGPRTEV
jgi:hypothetical protein